MAMSKCENKMEKWHLTLAVVCLTPRDHGHWHGLSTPPTTEGECGENPRRVQPLMIDCPRLRCTLQMELCYKYKVLLRSQLDTSNFTQPDFQLLPLLFHLHSKCRLHTFDQVFQSVPGIINFGSSRPSGPQVKQGTIKLNPILYQVPGRGEVPFIGLSDWEPETVSPGEGLLRVKMIIVILREPAAEGMWPRDFDRAIIVLYTDKGDVCEHPDERLRIMPVQPRRLLLEFVSEYVQCHEWNGSGYIVVCRRKFVPRGEVVVVENSLRFSSGRDVVHQVVETDIAMMNPINPETVVAWGVC